MTPEEPEPGSKHLLSDGVLVGRQRDGVRVGRRQNQANGVGFVVKLMGELARPHLVDGTQVEDDIGHPVLGPQGGDLSVPCDRSPAGEAQARLGHPRDSLLLVVLVPGIVKRLIRELSG